MKLRKSLLVFLMTVCLGGISVSSALSDVSTNHWAYNQMKEMQDKKIIQGYGNGEFRPYDYVTREQLATILTNAFDLKTSGNNTYSDMTDSNWATKYAVAIKPYFDWEEYNGNIFFNPKKNSTRQEVVTIATYLL